MTLDTRPSTPLQHDPSQARPRITGPEQVKAPYPLYLAGKVQRGFGRGSKDLGCPTANLPDEAIAPYSKTIPTGVYYGFAQVTLEEASQEHGKVWPMVMSIGYNPYYKNETRTAEVHILHDFGQDFYGLEMKVVVLGFVRPELDYAGIEALINDINIDKEVAINSVKRPAYATYAQDPVFSVAPVP